MSGDVKFIMHALRWALLCGISAGISIPLSINVGNQIISMAAEIHTNPFMWMLLAGAITALTGWFLEARVTRRVLSRNAVARSGLEMIGLSFEIMGGLLILGAFTVAGTMRPI